VHKYLLITYLCDCSVMFRESVPAEGGESTPCAGCWWMGCYTGRQQSDETEV